MSLPENGLIQIVLHNTYYGAWFVYQVQRIVSQGLNIKGDYQRLDCISVRLRVTVGLERQCTG